MKRLLHTMSLTAAFLIIGASTASAEKLGALQIHVEPGVDSNVRDAATQAIGRAGSSGKWTWIAEPQMRGKVPAAARDCFTSDCLKAAGQATGADGGVRVRLTGQAEIYDWTIDVYDLHKGTLASTEKGACELCGVSEVRTQFEASARAAVASASISAPKPVAAQPKPEPRTPPADPAPIAKPEPRPPTDELPPIENAAAGLVMVEIDATPADTRIILGGQEIGRGGVTVSLEHGTYEIQFAREGYGGLIETLVVGPHSTPTVAMRVHLAKTDPDAVQIANEGPIDRLGTLRRTYGIVGLSSGAVLLGTGIWLNAIDGRPTCGGAVTSCPRVRETSAAAFVTTVAGAALVTGGAVFLAWDALTGRSESAQAARIVPILGENVAGVGLVGRF